jgi:hypothetical protein
LLPEDLPSEALPADLPSEDLLRSVIVWVSFA